jgi:hypothetical protein
MVQRLLAGSVYHPQGIKVLLALGVVDQVTHFVCKIVVLLFASNMGACPASKALNIFDNNIE